MHNALCKAFIIIICRMHTIYTCLLRVLIIAAIWSIVALKFCSGNTIPIKTTYERTHMLTAQNATVAQTNVGIDDFNCMKMMRAQNVLHMLTTGTFAHAQKSTTCACHSLVKLLSIISRNTLQNLKQTMNYGL